MTFEELQRLAWDGKSLPRGTAPEEVVCYWAMKAIYRQYRAGSLPKETAAMEKQQLEAAMLLLQKDRRLVEELARRGQRNIRNAREWRGELNIGLAQGRPAEELLPLAVKIIRAMTGETRKGENNSGDL